MERRALHKAPGADGKSTLETVLQGAEGARGADADRDGEGGREIEGICDCRCNSSVAKMLQHRAFLRLERAHPYGDAGTASLSGIIGLTMASKGTVCHVCPKAYQFVRVGTRFYISVEKLGDSECPKRSS